MSSSSIRYVPYFLLFVLAALLLCHSWYGPDIWYHLTWGRGVIESGQIWPVQQTLLTQPVDANVYWLFQGLMYLGYKTGGIYLVSALFLVLWFAIAVLWLRLTQALDRPWLGPWLFFAFVICNQIRFEHRPEIFSYLFVLLFAQWFLKRESASAGFKQLALLFVMQTLWTNTHGYFALGVLIALAWLIACLVRPTRNKPQILQALAAVGVTVAGSLTSPAGIGSWMSVWANSRVGTLLRDINSELFAPTVWPLYWPFTIFWLVWALAIALMARAFWKRQNLFAAFLGLGGVLLSMQAVRNIPMVFLLGAPLLATLPNLKISKRVLLLNSGLCSILILFVCSRAVTGDYQKDMGSLGTFGIRLEWASYPIGAVEFLKSKEFRGKVFTDSYDGGYTEFHLPEAKVAGDSYFSNPEITREFFAAIKDPGAFLRLDQRFTFDALILNVENLEVMETILTSPDWTLVYSDSHRALFFRRALYPHDGIKLAQSSYYRGENLSNWIYAFGPISWSAIGRKHRDRAMLKKIVDDVSAAEAVPSTLVKMILAFAVDNYDRELVQAVQALRSKTYESEPGDSQALTELDEKSAAVLPMIHPKWREALVCAFCLTLLSWASVRAGIYLGEIKIPPNQGYPVAGEVEADLFRFDAVYYKAIAEDGYSYNGDPSSSPNIVFAPLFPLMVRALQILPGLDTVSAGFLLNKILLFSALALLFFSLRTWLSREKTFLILLAMVTAAGSYSFHAFYSESTFLFFVSLLLFFYTRENWIGVGAAAGLLAASRLTGVPIAVAVSCALYFCAWKAWVAKRKSRQATARHNLWVLIFGSYLCLAGVCGYLGYIALEFGNPFTLLPEIQQSSWGRFHPPTEIASLFGPYIFSYIGTAFSKGWMTFFDIQTLNLIWTLLGLASAVYLVRAWRWHVLTLVFLPYVLFIYYSNTSSEYLISAHRFFVLMVPLFMMMAALVSLIQRRVHKVCAWIAAALLLIVNIGYGLLHTAAFNQGVWFWF